MSYYMTYTEALEASKAKFPFDRWEEGREHGLEQYTTKNCDKARGIFNVLIAKLISLGSAANESDKIAAFETAVIALNDLNEELDDCFIETGEREDLCELCNIIAEAARIDYTKYGDGEGLASEWRDW
jgi:hypothetical protein